MARRASSPRRKICVVTSSRADYGYLAPLMREIAGDRALRLQVIASGMHLSREFGLTYRAIERDGFRIDHRIPMPLTDDSPAGIARSMGLGTVGFGAALEKLRPDFLVLLGDRFETLSAAQAALVARIPLAHICGGDTTEGAFDEAIRHSITKMAHLHFVTNADSARRVRQLGEDPRRIHDFGSPALDFLKTARFLDRKALAREFGIRFAEKNLLVTFHPATLDRQRPSEQFAELLAALEQLLREHGDRLGVIFTRPNADTYGRALNAQIDAFTRAHAGAQAFASLGQLGYLSVARIADAVVGNSSSGVCEIPSLRKPTVNLGDRQKGRLMAASVLNAPCARRAVASAIRQAMRLDCSRVRNPYGSGNASRRIKNTLRDLADPQALVQKHFHDLGLDLGGRR